MIINSRLSMCLIYLYYLFCLLKGCPPINFEYNTLIIVMSCFIGKSLAVNIFLLIVNLLISYINLSLLAGLLLDYVVKFTDTHLFSDKFHRIDCTRFIYNHFLALKFYFESCNLETINCKMAIKPWVVIHKTD